MIQKRHVMGIIIGGLIAAILDIIYAMIMAVQAGYTAVGILQAVASGLLGAAAFQGGIQTVALGLFLHSMILVIAAAIYCAVSLRFPMLLSRVITCGFLFGVLVYLFMNFVVLPLSAVPFKVTYTSWKLLQGFISHGILVGLPISMAIRWGLSMNDKQESNISYCVHCTTVPAETRDHVPPKSFFPIPRPSNLITVPSCLECNQGAGKDEDYFLATFMFSNAGTTDSGRGIWNRLRRTYEKNVGLRRRIAGALRRKEFYTTGGIYLGQGMTIDYDEKRFDAVVTKIVRGLYFYEQGIPLDLKAEMFCVFLREPAHFATVKQHNHMLKPGKIQWKGTFRYRCGFVPGDPVGSMWLLRFWEAHDFWVITNREGTRAKVRAKMAASRS